MSQDSTNHVPLLSEELASTFDSLEYIVNRVEGLLDQLDLDEELAYKILLLTSEAVTNAIEHGNQLDPSKRVFFQLDVKPDRVSLSIEDEGAGYDIDEVADPLRVENLMKGSGRGLFFIDSMADEVLRDRNGCRLRLIFNRVP